MKSLKSLLSAALVGASLFSQTPAKAEEVIAKPYVQTSFVSAFVSPAGPAINENCRQDYLSFSKDGNAFGIWQNQFLGEKGVAERDYIFSKSFNLTDNLTASAGFQLWDYPNGRFGKNDSVETLGLAYTGDVNVNADYLHLNDNGVSQNGDRFVLKVSKDLKLIEGKTSLTLTPYISTSLNNNYYGHFGLGHVTPGVTLSLSHGNFSLSGFINAQRAVDSSLDNLNWGGITAGYQF
jgi:hypothetical protein